MCLRTFLALYVVDIPKRGEMFFDTFADDSVFMSTDKSLWKAVENLQQVLEKVRKFSTNWKIKLNETKSVCATLDLSHRNGNFSSYLNRSK